MYNDLNTQRAYRQKEKKNVVYDKTAVHCK